MPEKFKSLVVYLDNLGTYCGMLLYFTECLDFFLFLVVCLELSKHADERKKK